VSQDVMEATNIDRSGIKLHEIKEK